MHAAKRPYSYFQLSVAPSMPKINASTIVKLIIACMLVGLVLSILDIDPWNILASDQAPSFLSGPWLTILMGAIVIIPIWAILYFLKVAKNGN